MDSGWLVWGRCPRLLSIWKWKQIGTRTKWQMFCGPNECQAISRNNDHTCRNNHRPCPCFFYVYMSVNDFECVFAEHYSDVIMTAMASQIISVSIVCSTVCSGVVQRKRQPSASLAFVCVRVIHRLLLDSPHRGPVTRKMFLFDDFIMDQTTWLMIFHKISQHLQHPKYEV